jgi:hypothetical protein
MAVIKTSSWFTKLPADHCRIGISRGMPSAQKAPYRNYRQLTPGPWFKTCATPQEYVRLYYTEVLSKLDPKAVVSALAAMADGGIPKHHCVGKRRLRTRRGATELLFPRGYTTSSGCRCRSSGTKALATAGSIQSCIRR